MSDPIRELLEQITAQIAQADHATRADLFRYRQEYDDRVAERWRRFHDETADMRKQRELIIANLAAVEATKPVRIIVPVHDFYDSMESD